MDNNDIILNQAEFDDLINNIKPKIKKNENIETNSKELNFINEILNGNNTIETEKKTNKNNKINNNSDNDSYNNNHNDNNDDNDDNMINTLLESLKNDLNNTVNNQIEINVKKLKKSLNE